MKYNNYSGLTFLLLWCTICLSAQGWERRLPVWVQSAGTDVSLDAEGNMIILGQIRNTTRGQLVHLDASGETKWVTPTSGIGMEKILQLQSDRFAAFGVRPINDECVFSYIEIDKNGQEQLEQRMTIDSLGYMHLKRVVPKGDHHFLLFGYVSSHISQGHYNFATVQIDRQGQVNWIRSIDISEQDWCFDAIPTRDGNVVMSGLIQSNGVQRPFVIKVDDTGQEIWRTYDAGIGFSIRNILELPNGQLVAVSFLQPNGGSPRVMFTHLDPDSGAIIQQYTKSDLDIIPESALLDTDGNIVIAGNQQLANSPVVYRVTLAKLTPQAGLIWQQTYGQVNESQRVSQLRAVPTGGYVMVGEILDGGTNNQSYVIRTDKLGRSFTNYVRGQFFESDCAQPTSGRPLEDWYLEIASERDTFYGLTDQAGNYEVRVDTGQYTVRPLQPNIYWTNCLPEQQIQFSAPFDTATIDFPFAVTFSCPLLRVDVSTPFLRRCYENIYYVDYCNEGTEPAKKAMVEVALDPAFIAESSEPAWSSREGQLLRFEVGDVEVGTCGRITISGRLDCDNTVLGQSHCVTAQVYPDTLCTPPGINWDGSSIEVNGQCVGDSIQFHIRNVGDGNMLEELRYIVIEDLIIHRSGYFQLSTAEELTVSVPATGATYRLEAEQAEGHPGSSSPSVTVEGCRLNGQPFQTGIVTQNPFDEGDPFIAIDCQENIGSWDPNDIRVFPKGQGPEQLVDADTELEYHIRFQNTGTDTAFRVLIRDTLPLDLLDLSSLQVGAHSHALEWWVNGDGILHFEFAPIALPDSTSNEAASHGFVRFKIRQHEGNLPGTLINNRAAIYFDFNEPVITNTAWVKVKKPVEYQIINESHCTMDVSELERLTIVDTVPYPEVDSLYIYNVSLLPEEQISIDTTIQAGHTFLGMEWLEDGTVQDSLLNRWGCDSLIITNVTVDKTNNTALTTLEASLQLQLFPNPVTDWLTVSYQLPKVQELQISILDASGREVSQMADPKLNASGLHRIRWPVQQLPPGLYLLRMRVGERQFGKRFVVGGSR